MRVECTFKTVVYLTGAAAAVVPRQSRQYHRERVLLEGGVSTLKIENPNWDLGVIS